MSLIICIAFLPFVFVPTNYFLCLQVGYLAAGFEAQEAISSKKVVEVEATLESEWATLAAEKVQVFKASKALKATLAAISQKERELNVTQAALAATQVKVLADVVTT